jgi:hypothetical protein
VGEIIKRLISKLCLKKMISRAIAYLAPFQRGTGVPDAIESIVHGLNSLLQGGDLEEKTVFLLLYFVNAFNNIGRQFFIDEVFRLFPENY